LTLAAEAGQAFALAAITMAGDLRPWMLYLAAVADAGRLAVNIPAQSALVPNVVPAGLLPSAMAMSASVWSSAALAGPAVAGALLTVAGPWPRVRHQRRVHADGPWARSRRCLAPSRYRDR
jgi:hypothetical protein